MKLINPNNLGLTIDNFSNTYYSGKSISPSDRKQLAELLASRQGINCPLWFLMDN